MAELKTKSYTRRAVDKYYSERDRVAFTIEKGEKAKWKECGIDNKEIIRLIRAEYQKRISEQEK